jgi:hypothetical protein
MLHMSLTKKIMIGCVLALSIAATHAQANSIVHMRGHSTCYADRDDAVRYAPKPGHDFLKRSLNCKGGVTILRTGADNCRRCGSSTKWQCQGYAHAMCKPN